MTEKGAKSGKVAVVDVAHEALIRHWSLLRKWLDENRDKLRQKRKIEAAAQEWEEKGKAKDYLLQGKPLQDAKAFQKKQDGNLALSNLAEEFISKSLKQKWVRSLKTASFLIIPILLVFLAAAPYLKQQNYNLAWETIRSQEKNQGKRAALELLTEGCWQRKQYHWISSDAAFFLVKGCPSFSGEDLSFTNLSFAQLNLADLKAANLIGANLSFANLTDAYLTFGNLTDADLTGADLRNANLIGADLSRANLSRANLRNANLVGANLSSANLSRAKFSGANLRNANLVGADLSRADLRNANLSGVNLTGAKLQRAVYNKETKFPEKFDSASQQMLLIAPGVNLSDADLSFVDLSHADLKDVNLSNADLKFADLRYAKNLTPEQVKSANNWDIAIYDHEFRQKLNLK